MSNESQERRYYQALDSTPAPGTGCHPHLLKVANIGVRAGKTRGQMIEDMLNAIPSGRRRVSRREVEQAVDRALQDQGMPPGACARRAHIGAPSIDRDKFFEAARREVSKHFAVHDYEAELWECSPIRMNWEPRHDAFHLMKYLYGPTDHLFVGDPYDDGALGKTVRTAAQWMQYFGQGGALPPHIIPNPLSGKAGTTKSGKETFRGDSCVKAFRFAVVEFDDIPKQDQAEFLMFVRLPIAAIIDSGGKSLHAWVHINAPDADTWAAEVEERLFNGLLKPLGADAACKNEARMSRLPGHLRNTDKLQRLLYLAPEGKAIQA